MKALSLSVAAFAVLSIVACGPSEAEIAAQKEKATADSLAALAAMEKTYMVDAAASTVKWTGTMLGVKSHYGTVSLTDGKLAMKGPQITAGGFVVDLKSMAAQDSAYAPDGSKQGTKAMLIGHLMSPDFFAVDSFPTATFDITRVEGNTVYGNLTVRGKTNEEKVTDVTVTEADGMATVTGKLAFDRQKYGVAWSTGAKDMILNDNIELDVTLTAKAQ
ncbi:MAG: YceI family protein [Flavobacteriales bacterium]|jgi:polyisoprenoid-binding protein YceI|nr:YceI family protein [Flavobacteriales bacterium]